MSSTSELLQQKLILAQYNRIASSLEQDMPDIQFLGFETEKRSVEINQKVANFYESSRKIDSQPTSKFPLHYQTAFDKKSGSSLYAWVLSNIEKAGLSNEFYLDLRIASELPWIKVASKRDISWIFSFWHHRKTLDMSAFTLDLQNGLIFYEEEYEYLAFLFDPNTIIHSSNQR